MSEENPENSPDSPLSQACPGCGSAVDISGAEPLSEVQCPACGTAVRARTQFNHFMLESQIGVGGMGVVYRALDVNLNRPVALKVVLREYSSDPVYHAKFEHEARITAQVNHEHVVKVYSFGSDHGLFYIAMELVDRGSLDEIMNQEGRISEARALETGIQVAQGLNAALKRGLIHRDVKPGNILYADEHTAKIVDFGLAVPMERGAEGGKPGEEVWGTPYYIAPEKLVHAPEDFRSDIYSLGASLFHAIAGRPCFDGETTSLTALRQLKSKPHTLESVVPGVSSATAYVINRSLCVDPKDRHQSYEELIEHLNYARTNLLEGGKSPPKSDEVMYDTFVRQSNAARLKIAIVAGVALVLLGVLAVIGVIRMSRKKPEVAKSETPRPAVTGMSANEAYIEGRNQLIHGDAARAQEIFRELGGRGNLPHPLDRWVMLHEGLSGLLGGQLKDSQALFSSLAEKGPYSDAPEDRALANFFVDTSRTVALAQPVPGAVAKNFDSGNYASLGLFILALDDWEMSRFDDADSLFQAFVASDPKQPYDWITGYKPLAGKYTADLAAFKKASAAADAANDLKKEKQAMDDLETLKKGLQVQGRLPEKLALVEADLQKKIDAAEAEEKRRADQIAQQFDQESKVLTAAKAKYNALLPVYQYAEALDAIAQAQITDPVLGGERDNLLKKAQWLSQFKETIIADINAIGYPLPVAKINSAPIEGGVTKATQTLVEIQTKYGPVEVLWTEMPPAEILAISEYFTGKATTHEAVIERQWLSGVFAMTAGLSKDGKALLDNAAQMKPAYHDAMAIFDSGTTQQ